MEQWRELLTSGEPGDIEARMRRHDGVFRWFLIRFEPFRDETGKIVMWYGVNTDIENHKQTQEKLREDERELRRITDAIPQTIVVLDPSGARHSTPTKRHSTIRAWLPRMCSPRTFVNEFSTRRTRRD